MAMPHRIVANKFFWRVFAVACVVLAIVSFYFMRQAMLELDPKCASQASAEGCRNFVPWLWSACVFAVLAIAALIPSIFHFVSMSRRTRFSIVFLTTAAVLGVSWLFIRPMLASNNGLVAESPQRVGDADSLVDLLNETAPEALARRGAEAQRPSKSLPHPFPEIPKSRRGLPLENDPFLAESPAEQEWLDRNGYPNAKQWKAYSLAPDVQLLQATQAGDSVAEVMLNGRKLAAGDPSAKEELLLASVEGSGFALQIYSAYMAGSGSGGNPQTAYALSRVAEMRGDYRLARGCVGRRETSRLGSCPTRVYKGVCCSREDNEPRQSHSIWVEFSLGRPATLARWRGKFRRPAFSSSQV